MAADAGHSSAGGGHDEEEHANHEAWVIPYADMVTLLMALFLMLYAIGQLDLRKFEALSGGLSQSLGDGSKEIIEPLAADSAGAGPMGGDGLLESQMTTPQLEPGDQGQGGEAAELARQMAAETATFDETERRLIEAALAAGLGESLHVRREPRGLVVQIGADQLLFDPGEAALRPGGLQALGLVASVINGLPNQIVVEGHTDSRPISTSAFPSNWELSTARATTVLRQLVAEGLAPNRVSAAGFAEQRPVADNATSEGRQTNRRVDVIVVSEHAGATPVEPPPPEAEIAPDLELGLPRPNPVAVAPAR